MSQLLLAIDTSGKNGSLALARTMAGLSKTDICVLEVVPLAGGAFSAQLVPEIAALLKKHEYSKTDLGAFAVANGPGSFTGLRVGLAAIKALAEVLRKPIVAISVLEAIAGSSVAPGATSGRVLAALDAGRGDVYVGDYELGPQLRMHSERVLSGEEFLVAAKSAETRFPETRNNVVVTPDARLEEMARAGGVGVERIEYPDSAVIARLGWVHLQRGEAIGPEELEANYIRRSDAEIFPKPAP